MEHVVFFPDQTGAPAFRRVASLEEAVRLVEYLRNVQGVGEFSVHTLTEVPLAVRAYYRVELPTDGTAPAAQPAEPRPEAPAVEAPVALEPPAETAEPVHVETVEPPVELEPQAEVAEPAQVEQVEVLPVAEPQAAPALTLVPEPAPEPVLTLAPEPAPEPIDAPVEAVVTSVEYDAEPVELAPVELTPVELAPEAAPVEAVEAVAAPVEAPVEAPLEDTIAFGPPPDLQYAVVVGAPESAPDPVEVHAEAPAEPTESAPADDLAPFAFAAAPIPADAAADAPAEAGPFVSGALPGEELVPGARSAAEDVVARNGHRGLGFFGR